MKVASWLRRPAIGLVVLGLLIGTLGAISGCGSDAKKPAPPKDKTAKPDDKPKEGPPAKPEEKPTPETKPEVKPEEKPAPETKPEVKPEEKPAPETKPEVKPEEKPAPETKPEMKPEEKPAPETKPEEKPAATPAGSGSPSADAKISSYAPAEDLEAQMAEYLKDLGEAVASEEAYKDVQEKLPKDANTIIVVALTLGLHDQDNKFKKAAPGVMKAAAALGDAKDLAAAKKAVEELNAAADGQGDASQLKWEKVANMAQLMKAVPLISNKIKDSSLTAARLEKRGKTYAGYAAVLAAIAQGSIPNAGDTEKPTEVEKWHKYCLEMRDAAGELNAAIRAKNPEAAIKANGRLRKSCDDCHVVFHEKALGKTGEESATEKE